MSFTSYSTQSGELSVEREAESDSETVFPSGGLDTIAIFIARIRKHVKRLMDAEHPLEDMYPAFQSIRTLTPGPLSMDVVLENSQYFEDLMQNFQSGGGTSEAEVVDLNNAVIVLEKSRRKNKKYQAEEVIFKARVDPESLPSRIAGVPLGTIVGAVRQLFLTIIERSTETLAPTDVIQFYIQDDHLDHPISTTIMPVSDLTIKKILTEILKVLQSKKSIQLDSGFKVEVITIRLSVGSGKTNCRVTNVSLDRLQKQSILSIPIDDDNLCCAKAIVFALAQAKKEATAIAAMKNRNRPALKKRPKSYTKLQAFLWGLVLSKKYKYSKNI
ncbi:DNA-directed DNA polymerase [Caerostris darwini]|uniref:DNA-directed DNA polymerase n=1 Tax=Caerostris darwini TaxID=1538125 RepID=A0AAV4TCC9_9ARAC|nr:DNA-directed DNA polymerase [Caerostris darwini]